MDTFIVRIYRPPKGASRLVLGVVERVGTSGVLRFSDFDELREILIEGKRRRIAVRTDESSLGVGK